MKSDLINKMYKMEPDGTLSLQLEQPVFQEAQKATWVVWYVLLWMACLGFKCEPLWSSR